MWKDLSCKPCRYPSGPGTVKHVWNDCCHCAVMSYIMSFLV